MEPDANDRKAYVTPVATFGTFFSSSNEKWFIIFHLSFLCVIYSWKQRFGKPKEDIQKWQLLDEDIKFILKIAFNEHQKVLLLKKSEEILKGAKIYKTLWLYSGKVCHF